MQLRLLLCGAAAALALAGPATADEKLVTITMVRNPRQEAMLSRLSPEERAQVASSGIGKPVRSVYFFSGSRVRCDIGDYTTLIDSRTNIETVINRQTHRYSTRPFNGGNVANAAVSVKATGQSKNILGHRARLYKVTLRTPDSPEPVTADVWSAPGLPRPSAVSIGGPAQSLMSAFNQIDGLPLAVVIHANSGYGPLTVTSTVQSISTTPLMASTFAIPAGDKPAPPGAGVGAPPLTGRF